MNEIRKNSVQFDNMNMGNKNYLSKTSKRLREEDEDDLEIRFENSQSQQS